MTNYLKPDDAARRMGVTLNYVYILLRTNHLKAKKKDGQWQIPESEVEARIEARKAARK